jgi:hypothetical protein
VRLLALSLLLVAGQAAAECVPVAITGNACGFATTGELTADDCRSETGAALDLYEIRVTGAPIPLRVTLRPGETRYSGPSVAFLPQPGAPSPPPRTSGGAHAEIVYAPSPGVWRIAVTSENTVARGAYTLSIDCLPPSRACAQQTLTCNQTGLAAACRDSNGVPFASWRIWGVEGDAIALALATDWVIPGLLVKDDTGAAVRSVQGGFSRNVSTTFRAPRTGWYDILSTNAPEPSARSFALRASCARSGCMTPIIVSPLPNRTVDAYGDSIALSVDVDSYGAGPLLIDLLDAETGAVLATSSTLSLPTPPIDRPRSFQVHARTDCGARTSETFVVAPPPVVRRRAVRP